jgi:hypothetical protein
MKFMIPFLMTVLPAAPSRDKARPAATRRPSGNDPCRRNVMTATTAKKETLCCRNLASL